MPGEPATEEQRRYASDLGIVFGPDVTKDDLSDLIELALHTKYPPPRWLEVLAKQLGLDHRRPMRRLFLEVELELVKTGHERDLHLVGGPLRA